jgi:hypothetical protein
MKTSQTRPTRTQRRTLARIAALSVLMATVAGCAAPPDTTAEPGLDETRAGPSPEQQAFWTGLEALCGLAFPGTMRMGPDDSDWWDASSMIMHVRSCDADEIRIPLHVDEDRSRTWVVRRTASGLELKHDHRKRDGTPDASNTDYGGQTLDSGSPWRQIFPADAYSVGVVPARASQHWFLELRPGQDFSYGLLREAVGLRYLVEFDLTQPITPPPPPWGWEEP